MHLYCHRPQSCIHGNGQVETKAGLPHDRGINQEPSVTAAQAVPSPRRSHSPVGSQNGRPSSFPHQVMVTASIDSPKNGEGMKEVQGTSRRQVWRQTTCDAVTKYFCQMPALQCRSEVWLGVGWETGLETGVCLTDLRQEPDAWAFAETGCWGPPGPDSNTVRKHSKTYSYKHHSSWPYSAILHIKQKKPHINADFCTN